MTATAQQIVSAPLIRLDIGCGPNKRPDHIGIDAIAFPGVDHVLDAGTQQWPFEDGSVESIHTSHFMEHLTAPQRVYFVNEAYRVLRDGGQCLITVPHWGSARAYGDPTHQWPPVSEFWFYYLSRDWRAQNAPHTDAKHWPQGFNCHFEATWGYATHPTLQVRNQEFQMFALQFYKEAAQDICATLTKR